MWAVHSLTKVASPAAATEFMSSNVPSAVVLAALGTMAVKHAIEQQARSVPVRRWRRECWAELRSVFRPAGTSATELDGKSGRSEQRLASLWAAASRTAAPRRPHGWPATPAQTTLSVRV
jgi:hypothetical protein